MGRPNDPHVYNSSHTDLAAEWHPAGEFAFDVHLIRWKFVDRSSNLGTRSLSGTMLKV